MNRILFIILLTVAALTINSLDAQADVMLGPFDFNSNQFGNTLIQSDGGTHANENFLNVVNANPGSPAFLTGPNFDTGIANIGAEGPLSYTIGYNTPILNEPGFDLGVVVARFSTDSFLMAVSADGVNFGNNVMIPADFQVTDTGVQKQYFFDTVGPPPFPATLWVHSFDIFNTFGVNTVRAVRITGTTELDLIRVAGLNPVPAIPEPSTFLLGATGLALLACRRFLRKQ